jgi:hypothetical protein
LLYGRRSAALESWAASARDGETFPGFANVDRDR